MCISVYVADKGQNEGSKVLQVVARLQTFDTQRKSRSQSILKWAITATKSLKEAFDEYVNEEISEMKDILTMLASVGQEVDEERNEIRKLENRYLRANDELNTIIDSANRNKIRRIDITKNVMRQQEQYTPYGLGDNEMPSISNRQEVSSEVDELDLIVIIEAFSIVGEVDKTRQKIDRLSRNYTKNLNDIKSVFDAWIQERGSGGSP